MCLAVVDILLISLFIASLGETYCVTRYIEFKCSFLKHDIKISYCCHIYITRFMNFEYVVVLAINIRTAHA